MKTLTTVCISLLVILYSSLAFATNNYDLPYVGARASAMGGAYLGLSNDVTATQWNPAGLTLIKQTEWQLTGRSRTETIKNEYPSDASYNTDNSYSHFGIDFAGVAIPVTLLSEKTVFAISYQRAIELDTFYKNGMMAEANDVKGGVFSLSPALAIEPVKGISLGAVLNIWMGKRICDATEITNWDFEWEAKYSGTNATIGLQVDLQKYMEKLPLTVGIAAKTPFKLGIDYEDLTFGTDIDSATVISYDLEVPLMFGVGLAYRPMDNLVLSADYENRLWSKSELFEYHNGNKNVYLLSKTGDDIVHLRFGAEYSKKIGETTVALRGGFARIPTLNADYYLNHYTDQTISYRYSAGLGFARNSYALDLTWSRQSYDRDVDTGITFPTPGEYTHKQQYQMIQISGRFFVNLW